MRVLKPDLAVIGAGSGGLSVAAGAAQMGAAVVLVEHDKMGGDCLNTGCVPSKSTIAAAGAADAMRRADRFGIGPVEPRVDYAALRAHLRGVIAALAPNDSVERFEGLGVTVLRGTARFTGPRSLDVDGVSLRPRRVVLATGSRAAAPPVPGLAETPHLTNETVFDLAERPGHLLVLGGGPIGVELAQAHRRLGTPVTLVEAGSILPRDDPEAVAVVRAALGRDGVALNEGAKLERVAAEDGGIALHLADGRRLAGSHLLVAAGRRPNIEALDLERAGIAWTDKGLVTDGRLRTTNRRVFAVGDVAGRQQFTHIAGYHASLVVRQLLFRLPARLDDRAVPWVTYADPELAQVGLSAPMARERGLDLRPLTWPFAENDRARAERAPEGFVKLLVDRRGRVKGATIVGRGAGELIHLWGLVVAQRIKVGAVAQMIAPYPTLGEAGKRAAGSYYTPALFGPRTRRLVRFLGRFG